jgi:hypothetical protein
MYHFIHADDRSFSKENLFHLNFIIARRRRLGLKLGLEYPFYPMAPGSAPALYRRKNPAIAVVFLSSLFPPFHSASHI